MNKTLPKYEVEKKNMTIEEILTEFSNSKYEITDTIIDHTDTHASEKVVASLINILPFRIVILEYSDTNEFKIWHGGTTMHDLNRFINNEYPIQLYEGLDSYNYNGKYFKDLTEEEQKALTSRHVEVYYIDMNKKDDKSFLSFVLINLIS